MIRSQYTRFRSYRIADGCAFSYMVNREFCLIGGRYPQSMQPSLAEEMRIAGCDTIDLLHIPSWDGTLCHPGEIGMLLERLRPTEIEIPDYLPQDKSGEECKRIIEDYYSRSNISELTVCSPDYVRQSQAGDNNRYLLSPIRDYRNPTDKDLIGFFGQGRFSVLSTGGMPTEEVVKDIMSHFPLQMADVFIVQGMTHNPLLRLGFINDACPKILIDALDDSQYYRRANVDLEKFGISTMRTSGGDVIVTCGENDVEQEISIAYLDSSTGTSYWGESKDRFRIDEQIQGYVWTHPIDDLDSLAHHYEVEDVSDIHETASIYKGDAVEKRITFKISVTFYLDNEDHNGFKMSFPAKCRADFVKRGEDYMMQPETVTIKVNTDEYYR